jgi:glycerate-2-kinase
MNEASHPIPNQNGVNGILRMLEVIKNLSENDVVITLISGGGSALMPFPANNITLDDIQVITSKLLKSGANINEINSVRKHLSAFKGGQLASKCFPANVISLIISDVINDPLDTIASGPTAPDNTTFKTAKEILEKYHLWRTSSINIKERIKNGYEEKIPDTPKENDPIFKKVHNFIIANNKIAVQKSLEKAEELGYNSVVLSTFIEGEAREVGKVYSGIIKEIVTNKRPIEPPCAIIIGGETTVTVKGNGIGGRNQELALSAVKYIDGLNCVLATLGTDGIDGTSEVAGSIIDGSSYERGINKNQKIEKILEDNNSFQFFKELNDFLMTGPTGTNVNDLSVILVS